MTLIVLSECQASSNLLVFKCIKDKSSSFVKAFERYLQFFSSDGEMCKEEYKDEFL